MGRKLGTVAYRETYAGVFYGLDVAVKIATPAVTHVKRCTLRIEKAKLPINRYEEDCYMKPNMKMLKEILLISELDHPGITQLLGFCLLNENISLDPNPIKNGIVAVFERASQLTI